MLLYWYVIRPKGNDFFLANRAVLLLHRDCMKGAQMQEPLDSSTGKGQASEGVSRREIGKKMAYSAPAVLALIVAAQRPALAASHLDGRTPPYSPFPRFRIF